MTRLASLAEEQDATRYENDKVKDAVEDGVYQWQGPSFAWGKLSSHHLSVALIFAWRRSGTSDDNLKDCEQRKTDTKAD
jgi:hypothetical protein